MTIRAVVFDVGGVLSRWVDFTVYRQWEERVGLPEGGLAALVFENEVARRATLGAASSDEVWQYVGQQLGLTPGDLERLKVDFWEGSEWNQDLLAFIRTLRLRCKTAILSDAWANVREIAAPYVNYDTFDVIMYSAEEGIQKPNPEIFKRLLARLEVAPAETIFVDDRPANVDAACQLGIHGLLFTDSHAIRDEITRLIQ